MSGDASPPPLSNRENTAMGIALVVTQPFANYAKGDQITDAETVKMLLADHSHRVVKIGVADEAPAPAPQNSDPA